jgi:cellulose synthase/poly-beta-1,6-N-acetylglucosamine synthase-like glycosyltransferase
MSALATIVAWILAAPPALAGSAFATEVIAGLRATSGGARGDTEPPSRVAVLIPAHDEEASIAATVIDLRQQVPAAWRILVVADNCSDATARAARDVGAEVIERHDHAVRGKGHALAFGRDFLRRDPPEVVIVLDADCRIWAPQHLAASAKAGGAPFQSNNLLAADLSLPAMVQVSTFAFAVKNLLRQRGLVRIGAPAVLMGTGMAVPWHLFEAAPLATSHLAEDLQLGIHFLRVGAPARFEPRTEVRSNSSSASGTLSQRSRWEGGFLASARQNALPLMGEGLRRRRGKMFWMGLHLAVPPLTLLIAALVAALAATAILAAVGGSAAPLIVLAAATGAVIAALTGAWLAIGRQYLSGSALLRLPLYMLWKIPLYLRLLRRRERSWVRTERRP